MSEQVQVWMRSIWNGWELLGFFDSVEDAMKRVNVLVNKDAPEYEQYLREHLKMIRVQEIQPPT